MHDLFSTPFALQEFFLSPNALHDFFSLKRRKICKEEKECFLIKKVLL